MGTVIMSSAMAGNGSHSSLELTVSAGLSCIEKSGLGKGDIDLLIHTGIYHDDNIMEPATAPLIQKKLGLNPDPVYNNTNYTFCFDLYNGPCGFIYAAFVADSFLRAGKAKHALIVSGDAHPSKRKNEAFPFACLGGAAILTHDSMSSKGFRNFYFDTSETRDHGLLAGGNPDKMGESARGTVFFYSDENYTDTLRDFSISSVRKYVASQNVNLDEINYLITAQQTPDMPLRIQKGIGMNGTSHAVRLHESHGDPHSSSLTLGFHTIMEKGILKDDDVILFAATGSGLTTACAMYTV